MEKYKSCSKPLTVTNHLIYGCVSESPKKDFVSYIVLDRVAPQQNLPNRDRATRIHSMANEEARSARWIQRTETVPPWMLVATGDYTATQDGSQGVFRGDMATTCYNMLQLHVPNYFYMVLQVESSWSRIQLKLAIKWSTAC